MHELKIYAIVNEEGKILRHTQDDNIYECAKLIIDLAECKVRVDKLTIRPITIHPVPLGHNILLEHWENLDLTMQRLSKCAIYTGELVLDFKIDSGWYIRSKEFGGTPAFLHGDTEGALRIAVNLNNYKTHEEV